MNKELEQFIEHITNPENAEVPDSEIQNQIILKEGLTLCCNYAKGIANITGVAFSKPITIMFNYFYFVNAFTIKFDGKKTLSPISLNNLKHFFNEGNFPPETCFVKV